MLFYLDEKLLGMASNLGAVSCRHESLQFLPIFTTNLEGYESRNYTGTSPKQFEFSLGHLNDEKIG